MSIIDPFGNMFFTIPGTYAPYQGPVRPGVPYAPYPYGPFPVPGFGPRPLGGYAPYAYPGTPLGPGYPAPYPAPYDSGPWPTDEPAPYPIMYRQTNKPTTPVLRGGSENLQNRVPHIKHIDLSAMFPKEIFLHGPRNQNRISLTFDDGPDDVWTPQVLNALKQHNIKATFFIVGERAAAHPQVLQRIVREGHVVGNHSWDHPNFTKITADERVSQINRTAQTIEQIAKVKTKLFRPPYGALDPDIVREIASMDYDIIFWDVDSLDWSGLNGPQVVANVLAHAERGSIILQHCAGGHGENLSGTVAAIPYLATVLEKEGFQFATVPELLKITPYRT